MQYTQGRVVNLSMQGSSVHWTREILVEKSQKRFDVAKLLTLASRSNNFHELVERTVTAIRSADFARQVERLPFDEK